MSRRDDEGAFESFVADCSGRLLRTAYLLCGDRGDAEDLVQTALFRTARRWPQARRHPEAYARRVLANLAKDRWRGLGRRPREVRLDDAPLDEPSLPGPDAVGPPDAEHLVHALAQLPPRQRAVVVLRFLDDLSVAETAAALDCSEGTVKSQTSRALERLRSAIHLEKENGRVE